ncbi:hypothetical protein C4901_15805 [Acidiferrobacter sp. SPIII_3]|nr:hypothetical protein C4901_15805 [Acidiferrobacter sp. SPIII_3]
MNPRPRAAPRIGLTSRSPGEHEQHDSKQGKENAERQARGTWTPINLKAAVDRSHPPIGVTTRRSGFVLGGVGEYALPDKGEGSMTAPGHVRNDRATFISVPKSPPRGAASMRAPETILRCTPAQTILCHTDPTAVTFIVVSLLVWCSASPASSVPMPFGEAPLSIPLPKDHCLMPKIYRTAIAVLIGTLSFSAAHAAGFYAGANAGASDVQGLGGSASAGIYAGYAIDSWLSVEAGYNRLGRWSGSDQGQPYTNVINNVDVSLTVGPRIGRRLRVYGQQF